MTEEEWLTAKTERLAGWLGKFPERQRLLFICACAGLVNPLFPEECPAAIDYITEIADGVRLVEEIANFPCANLSEDRHPLRTIQRAISVARRDEDFASCELGRAVGTVANDHAYFRIREMPIDSDWREIRKDTQRAVKAVLWRFHLCIFNPFRPAVFDPAWRTEHTVGLAARMYEDREFAAMPILADALEEAGCDNADVLSHCREPGPHARGCCVVDGVLGKR